MCLDKKYYAYIPTPNSSRELNVAEFDETRVGVMQSTRRSLKAVKGGSRGDGAKGSRRETGEPARRMTKAGDQAVPQSLAALDRRAAACACWLPPRGSPLRYLYSFFPFLFFLSVLMAHSSSSISHGSDVFQNHESCSCSTCEAKRHAVHRLVDSFSAIPADWIGDLAEHDGQFLPLPMWGTLFLVFNPSDVRAITRLFRTPDSEGDEEMESLAEAGWQSVGQTGVMAIPFRDELLLGIHGAGYSFHAHHWEPLYEALAYKWHHAHGEGSQSA